jgi:hypothetical protein
MKVQKTIGAGVLSLSLLVGLSGFAGAVSGDISDTGPRSHNIIKSETRRDVKVENDNDLSVRNDNDQRANTGDARTSGNTTGGDAETGAAVNTNSLHVSATVNNAASSDAWADVVGGGNGGGSATIDTTGPKSTNVIKFEDTTKVRVENNNDISVRNDNNQTATSGDARVTGNTTGGDATTGDARNTNTTSVTLNVSN